MSFQKYTEQFKDNNPSILEDMIELYDSDDSSDREDGEEDGLDDVSLENSKERSFIYNYDYKPSNQIETNTVSVLGQGKFE